MDEHIGHYRIVSELGRGGMGVVYKAHEESLNRFVAIKLLGSHLAEDADYVERFVREAQSAARLSHPNIVQIYAISEEEGQHFFVMEYVSGTSVQRLLKDEGSMDTVRAERIVLQAASGLLEAHEQGIIHRDIKPANLMIDDRGLVKITDFGLAIALGGAARLTATGMLMGTPGYLSPEQCRDDDVDHRTDIYSLGVTFFEMLTGSMPFTADSPLALIRQIVDVAPPDVRELYPEADDSTCDLLGRMMAKDRDQRFPSCAELIIDLQQDLTARGASEFESSAAAAVVVPPPPSSTVAEAADSLNLQPTVVVDSAEQGPVATTGPVGPETAPAAQPISVAPPPSTGKRRVALLAVLAVVLVAIGALAVGAVAVWKLGLGDRIASMRRGTTETGDQSSAPATEEDTSEPTGTGITTPVENVEAVSETAASAGSEVGREPPSTPDAITPPEPPTTDTAQGEQPVIRDRQPRTVQPVEPHPEPPPAVAAARGVAVVALGETLLATESEAFVESTLVRAGADLVDETILPEVADLFGGDRAPPRGALRDALRPHARHLILVRAEYLGDRPLSYMGRADVAFQARLTAAVVDLASGRVVGPPLNRKVEYTHLNVERVVSENLRRWLRQVRGSVTDQP
jgi:serine/threonine-protein kinase